MFWKYTEGCKHRLGFFYNLNDMANTLLVAGVVIPLFFYKKIYRSFTIGDFRKGWLAYCCSFYFRVRNAESTLKGNRRFVYRIRLGELEIGKHELLMTEEQFEDFRCESGITSKEALKALGG